MSLLVAVFGDASVRRLYMGAVFGDASVRHLYMGGIRGRIMLRPYNY